MNDTSGYSYAIYDGEADATLGTANSLVEATLKVVVLWAEMDQQLEANGEGVECFDWRLEVVTTEGIPVATFDYCPQWAAGRAA